MKGLKKHWRFMAVGGIMLAVAGGLQILARRSLSFGTWYAEHIYPALVGSVGRVFGWIPVSIVEFGLYSFLLFSAGYGIVHRKEGWRILSRTLMVVGLAALTYTLNCGINYYRKPFSSYMELTMGKSTQEELVRLCGLLTERVNEKAGERRLVPAAEDPAREGVRAMSRLGQAYPQMNGFYPKPKAVTCSEILSVQQLCGIYSPFTIEANYNRDMTEYNIPHTICHELSHLRGFMREDEANFIGFLACIGSESPDWEYSGYLTGWVYAGNALYKSDPEAYFKMYERLEDSVKKDLDDNNEFWRQYDGRIAEAAVKVNDSYLKANSQTDGVRSYGRMVDLMLAYYRDDLAAGQLAEK